MIEIMLYINKGLYMKSIDHHIFTKKPQVSLLIWNELYLAGDKWNPPFDILSKQSYTINRIANMDTEDVDFFYGPDYRNKWEKV